MTPKCHANLKLCAQLFSISIEQRTCPTPGFRCYPKSSNYGVIPTCANVLPLNDITAYRGVECALGIGYCCVLEITTVSGSLTREITTPNM